MRQELAEAFERQAMELEAVANELAGEKAAAQEQGRELTAVRQQLGKS